MPYIGGTLEVQSFIKKYKASGYLIDPYSDEWIAAVVKRANNNEINYESDQDTYESFDEDYGKQYRGHLLIVYVDIYNKELIEDLKKIYHPLKFIFDEQGSAFGTHKPDLLFINLASKQIFCAGLGRKNRLMQFDASRYAAGKYEPQIDVLVNGSDGNFDSKYVANFKALDHDEIIDKLIFNLKTLGDYLLVDHAGLDASSDDSEIFATYISESIEAIQVFFPRAEVADLNPEDY
jgi:hypothetical protein